MKKLFLVGAVLVISCFNLSHCYSAEYWAKTYGGSNSEYAEFSGSTQVTSDGGIISVGTTSSFNSSDGDIWIQKLDYSGNILWQKTYGGNSYEYATSIQEILNEGYIVAGFTNSFGAGINDIWVLRLDNSGAIMWQKTYGGRNMERAFSIQKTSDVGFIVAGWTDSFGVGNGDIWVLKLDASGNIIWEKTYGGSYVDMNPCIKQTADGGYVVGGQTFSFGVGNGDIWVLKLDASGNIIWEKTYGGSNNEFFESIKQTSEGDFIITGSTYSFDIHYTNFWVLKLNSDGDVSWQKTYGESGEDWPYSIEDIEQSEDGGYILAGHTTSFGAGGSDIWVLKLDASGNIIWEKTYGGSDHESASSIQQTIEGGYLVAGYTYSFGIGASDLLVLKIDSNGEIPDCTIMDTSIAIVADTYVVGQNTNAIVSTTFATVTDTSVTPEDISAEITTICQWIDSDNDGVPDDKDNCPLEDAKGRDANMDGCIDTIEDLTSIVLDIDILEAGIESGFLNKISEIQTKIDEGKMKAAIKQLNAFIQQAEAARNSDNISDDNANMLIEYANNIINSLRLE